MPATVADSVHKHHDKTLYEKALQTSPFDITYVYYIYGFLA